MLLGFKAFISRGNVIDLAVGVIIGAAFGGIVDSLTKDVIGPIIGMVFGNQDFSAIKLGAINIGNLMNAVVNFLLKALGLYIFIVLPFNRFAAQMAPPPSPTEATLGEIRDLLKNQQQARGASV